LAGGGEVSGCERREVFRIDGARGGEEFCGAAKGQVSAASKPRSDCAYYNQFVETVSGIKLQVETAGFAIVNGVLADQEIVDLIAALANVSEDGSLLRHGSVFAVRNLLQIPAIVALAQSSAVRSLVQTVLGDEFFPVRGILFDKIPDANWKVPWHQDVTIAVQKRVDADGFGPWSMKAGVLHVQPPDSILEQIISIRIHLDDCRETNGALRVIPGSHRNGRVLESQIPELVSGSEQFVCAVEKGGALLMRPLLLHASSPSSNPGHRRVVHFDFASTQLPNGLRWLSRRGLKEVPASG